MSPSPACASSTDGAREGSTPRRSARSPAAPGAFARTAPSASPATRLTSTPTSWRRSRAMSFPRSRPPNGATPGSTSSRSAPHALARGPAQARLRLSEEAQDETTLRQLSTDETVVRRARDRANLKRLWEACQTPDFRKTTQEEHTRLISALYAHLTQGDRRIPRTGMRASSPRWTAPTATSTPFLCASRACGRSPISPTAPTARRPGRLAGPRPRSRRPALRHAAPVADAQRFVDRRTSTLLRSLNQHAGPVGGIGADGAVTVEGHVVGRLSGVHFEPERGASALENRALRGAVERAVAPEIAAGSGNWRAKATRPSFSSSAALSHGAAWRRAKSSAAARSSRASGSSATSAPTPSASAPRGGSRPMWRARPAGGSPFSNG